MTGLLCITALTNEHSNKGELKDQCMWPACTSTCGSGGCTAVRYVHGWVHACELECVFMRRLKKRKCNLQRGMKEEGEKTRERRRECVLESSLPLCVTTEEALNNSHDIDLVTLLPSSLPQPREKKPTCRSTASPTDAVHT